MNKRDLEKLQFERFCRSRPDLLLTLKEQPEPPAPDVIADAGGRLVGIEITAYYHQKENKALESEEAKIVRRAKEIYSSKGGVPVRVSIA